MTRRHLDLIALTALNYADQSYVPGEYFTAPSRDALAMLHDRMVSVAPKSRFRRGSVYNRRDMVPAAAPNAPPIRDDEDEAVVVGPLDESDAE